MKNKPTKTNNTMSWDEVYLPGYFCKYLDQNDP